MCWPKYNNVKNSLSIIHSKIIEQEFLFSSPTDGKYLKNYIPQANDIFCTNFSRH